MTAPHTDRPFDAVEGATALSAARCFFLHVGLRFYRLSLLCSYCLPIPLFSIAGVWILLLGSRSPIRHYYRHRAPLGVLVLSVKNEEPASALPPTSGSLGSSSSSVLVALLVVLGKPNTVFVLVVGAFGW